MKLGEYEAKKVGGHILSRDSMKSRNLYRDRVGTAVDALLGLIPNTVQIFYS